VLATDWPAVNTEIAAALAATAKTTPERKENCAIVETSAKFSRNPN
jgi:hypothetical protein